MQLGSKDKVIAWAVSTAVALLLAAVLAAAISGTLAFTDCLGALGRGWIVPVVSITLIAGVVWLLARQIPRYRGTGINRSDLGAGAIEAPVCGRCGSAIMLSWRLCPRCGERLHD